MNKTKISLALYRIAKESENEQYLYLSCLEKIKATMTKRETKEFNELIILENKRKYHHIIKEVIDVYFGVDISTKTNNVKYSYPRKLYCYFCYKKRRETDITTREMARYVNLTHSSIYTGFKSVDGLLFIKDTETMIDCKKIKELIEFEL